MKISRFILMVLPSWLAIYATASGTLNTAGVRKNLTSLGALLDESASDQAKIENIYKAEGNGTVIDVPGGGRWSGTITAPVATRALTWNLLGSWPDPYVNFIGDGDLSIAERNGSLSLEKNLVNQATSAYTSIEDAYLSNLDAGYSGPGKGNFTQMAPVYAHFLTGATSTGNTSALRLDGESYGMNNIGAFDVSLSSNLNKYGSNATWGIAHETNDFTGRIPQAFSSWLMELDNVANGHDQSPMDPGYYIPGQGARVGVLLAPRTLHHNGWLSVSFVKAKSVVQGAGTNQIGATVISVSGTDGTRYVWVCSKSGTTGSKQPTWPAPAVFTGSFARTGIITVTVLQRDSPAIVIGDVLTGGGFVAKPSTPFFISAQLTGKPGGAGTYQSNEFQDVAATGIYADHQVTDGSAIWDFGTEQQGYEATGFWLGADGPAADIVGTAFGTNAKIYNAVLDASQARLVDGAAAIRLSAGQTIDLSYQESKASQNKRALLYAPGDGKLEYRVKTKVAFSVDDNGNEALAGGLTTTKVVVAGGGPFVAPFQTPSSSRSDCFAGQQEADANYIYVCVATDTWKRAALSNF